MILYIRFIFLLSFFTIFSLTRSHGRPVSNGVKDYLKLDRTIRNGRLSNGLTYFIKNIPEANTVDMYLYVKVGTLTPVDAAQYDFSHAVEHLAFKTLEHFPVNLLSNSKLHNLFGVNSNDISARTAGLFTNYFIRNIPQNKFLKGLDTGLLWFQDITNLQLTEKAINEERWTLRQEYIYRSGIRFSQKNKYESSLFPCHQHPDDFFTHNQEFPTTSLIKYYKKWYTPDRMAIIIVGNIGEIDKVEQHLTSFFSKVKGNKSDNLTQDCRLKNLNNKNRFVVFERKQEDKISTENYFQWDLLMREPQIFDMLYTRQGLQRKLLWKCIRKMLEARETNIKKVDWSGSINYSIPSVERPYSHFRIRVREGSKQKALQHCISFLKLIKEEGFSKEEFQKIKKGTLESMRRIETSTKSYWTSQIQDYFVRGEILPEDKNTILLEWFQDLQVEDINKYANEYISFTPDDIGIFASSGDTGLLYSEMLVHNWIQEAQQQPLELYIERKHDEYDVVKPLLSEELISALPKSNIVSSDYNEIGVEELILTNGIKVILHHYKPVEQWEDKILIRAFNPKGALSFPQEDYFSTINAPAIVTASGLGNLTGTEFKKFLRKSGLKRSFVPYITPVETGLNISGTKSELEAIFQVIYAYFNMPHKSLEGFESWKKLMNFRYSIGPGYSIPTADMADLRTKTIGDGRTLQGTLFFKGIEKTDLNRSYEIFNQLYGNASNFTFIISGDFSKEKILLLIQKFLGNLTNEPSSLNNYSSLPQSHFFKKPISVEYTTADIGATYPVKSIKYNLNYMSDVLGYTNWKERIKVFALGLILDKEAKRLRFKKNLPLFNPLATGGYNRFLDIYNIGLYIDCPDNEKQFDIVRKASKDLFENFLINGVKEEDFQSVQLLLKKASQVENLYKGIKEPKILSRIYDYYRWQFPWIDSAEMEAFIDGLIKSDIQSVARKYLKEENLVEIVFKKGKAESNQ